MQLSTHFIVSLIIAAILFPFFGFYSIIVLVGGFLIDIDHLIFYWFRFKSFNLKEAYNYYRNIALNHDIKEFKRIVLVCHSLEFVILAAILSFYYETFFILFLGVIVHIIMDMLYLYPIFKIMSLKKLSLFWSLKNAQKHN